MVISANGLDFTELNRTIKQTEDENVTVTNVLGQRYIGSGAVNKNIRIEGTPGNAIGAYLNTCNIEVFGNVQDATGDTMNNGKIIVHGNSGDTTGYAMRGGEIYVQGSAGYRVGIHMKEYKEHKPIIVIGKCAGDFLGEYQAGGVILVLDSEDTGRPAGEYIGTGMHGGVMYLRTNEEPKFLPPQVVCEKLEDNAEILPLIHNFCTYFNQDETKFAKSAYYKLTPNSKNPYKQLYTNN